MLTITYDAINGTPAADGLAMNVAELLWQGYKERGKEISFNPDTSSESLITAFRVLVKRGVIPCEELTFKYNDVLLECNKHGRIADWPEGFCDHTMNMTSELIRWNNND